MLFIGNPDPATGAYELGGLPTGDYIVQFSGYQGLDSYNEYFDGADTIDSADPVAVTIGETTTGIDGELGIPPGGVIAGRITDLSLRSFDFARVSAYRWDDADWVLAGQAESTYYESEYELPLPPGDYRLRYEGGSFLQFDLPPWEFYDDVDSVDDATSVTVALDARLDGFDVAVGNLSTGSISGAVTDAATGAPPAGIEVWVADRKGRVLTDQIASTAGDGSYTVDGLWPEGYRVEGVPVGTYRVELLGRSFSGPPLREFFDDVPTVDLATDVTVAAGEVTAGISGSLGQGPPGAIAATVTDGLGAPIAGIEVIVFDEDFQPEVTAVTRADGSYELAGFLPGGVYFVEFSAPNGGWADEWYDDVLQVQSATPVPVTPGVWSGGVDAALEPAGGISGTVTNEGGGSCSRTSITAFRWTGSGWSEEARTDVFYEFDYELLGLPEGVYRVKFRGGSIFNPTFGVEEYYDDALTLGEVTDVVVAVGSVTPGIGAVLGNLAGGEGAIVNGSFDDDLDGWSTDPTGDSSIHHGGVDLVGSALSGSAEVVSAGGTGTAGVAQCVAVDGGSGLRFGAWSRVSGGGAGSPAASARLEFFADAECSGEAISAATTQMVGGAHDWQPVFGVASAPSGAVAVRLDLELGNPEGTVFTAHWDEVEISVDNAVIMADGFESGAGGAWTVGAP